jgi:hypothetical protein
LGRFMKTGFSKGTQYSNKMATFVHRSRLFCMTQSYEKGGDVFKIETCDPVKIYV